MSERSKELDALLPDRSTIEGLPRSECMNCKEAHPIDLRLFKGRWYHVDMGGGQYYRPSGCTNPRPLRCKKCGGRIDYRTTDPSYYDFMCESCITKEKEGDKIGVLTKEMKKALASGGHPDFKPYLQYGTMCAVVLTKDGLFFVDIC